MFLLVIFARYAELPLACSRLLERRQAPRETREGKGEGTKTTRSLEQAKLPFSFEVRLFISSVTTYSFTIILGLFYYIVRVIMFD